MFACALKTASWRSAMLRHAMHARLCLTTSTPHSPIPGHIGCPARRRTVASALQLPAASAETSCISMLSLSHWMRIVSGLTVLTCLYTTCHSLLSITFRYSALSALICCTRRSAFRGEHFYLALRFVFDEQQILQTGLPSLSPVGHRSALYQRSSRGGISAVSTPGCVSALRRMYQRCRLYQPSALSAQPLSAQQCLHSQPSARHFVFLPTAMNSFSVSVLLWFASYTVCEPLESEGV